ncbi:MAG TPA: hypothetical protein VFC31_00015 [Candidatus Limnocylindria bacterium]|nr:hypothetical protein [Candidatus Limnocylindria bacterium]
MEHQDIARARVHRPRLVRSQDVHATVHGTGPLGRFNTWLAVHITRTVGTMWVAYAFALLALVSLPAALATHDVIVIVAWIAQTFLQLILLPIIMVGQNVIQAANDARAEADHETLTAVHRLTVEVHSINEAQTEILRELRSRSAPR